MKTRLILILVVLLSVAAITVSQAQSGGGYELLQSSFLAGGQASGGGYDLTFTLGQSAAGLQTGGGYELGGGFWGGGEATAPGSPSLYLPLIFSER